MVATFRDLLQESFSFFQQMGKVADKIEYTFQLQLCSNCSLLSKGGSSFAKKKCYVNSGNICWLSSVKENFLRKSPTKWQISLKNLNFFDLVFDFVFINTPICNLFHVKTIHSGKNRPPIGHSQCLPLFLVLFRESKIKKYKKS